MKAPSWCQARGRHPGPPPRDALADPGMASHPAGRRDSHAPDHLRSGADADVPFDRRAPDIAGAQADRDPGKDHRARVYLDQAVRHELSMDDVDARMDDDGIAD